MGLKNSREHQKGIWSSNVIIQFGLSKSGYMLLNLSASNNVKGHWHLPASSEEKHTKREKMVLLFRGTNNQISQRQGQQLVLTLSDFHSPLARNSPQSIGRIQQTHTYISIDFWQMCQGNLIKKNKLLKKWTNS